MAYVYTTNSFNGTLCQCKLIFIGIKMFKKPLHDAKKNNLKLSIALINARSKAMSDELTFIQTKLDELEENINQLRLKLETENLSEIDKRAIRLEVSENKKQKYNLESLRDKSIKPLINHMVICRDKILAEDTTYYASLSESSSSYLFDKEYLDKSEYSPFNRKHFPDTFFSVNLKKTETDFKNAQLNYDKMISFRTKAAAVLLITLYLISFASMIAIGMVFSLYVSPIAGNVIIALALALNIYYLSRVGRDYTNLMTYLTTVDEKIELGSSGEPLFPELDLLVENIKLGESNDEAGQVARI